MIIKGRAVGSVKHWSRYLAEQGENEKVTEREIRGTLARDLKGALVEMRDLASETRSEGNFLYHASFNPRPGENLTPEQWQQAIDRVEKVMGFEDHQRIVYEHVKEGRHHFHVLWNRTDTDTFTIKDITGDRYTLRRVANELEKEFGLAPTKAVREYNDARPLEEWELKQAQRSKIELKDFKAELTALWQATDSGKAFIAAIEERGYAIAKGDRRDFVILDRAGEVHSLARRLDGVKVADVRARFADVDRDSLPDITAARAAQSERVLEAGGTLDRDAAGRGGEEKLGNGAIPQDQRREANRLPAAEHPVFDRDAQDRQWQSDLTGGAIAHDAAERAAVREGWKQLKAAYAKDLAPEAGGNGQDPMSGDPAPKSFKEVWDGVVSAEKEERSLERSMPGPTMPAPTLTDMDGRRDAGMLSVLHAATNIVTSLAESVIDFFDPSPPKPMSREERGLAERRSERALDSMKRDLDQGRPFKDHDIKALTHHHLLQIREQGDPYLRDLLAKRDRERQRTLGNERER